MNGKTKSFLFFIAVLLLAIGGGDYLSYRLNSQTVSGGGNLGAATVLTAPQGGTGTSTTNVANVGKALLVSSVSPLVYTFGTAGGSITNGTCFNVTDGTTTSTLCANSFYTSTSTANRAGLFSVDSLGNVSTSGTLRDFLLLSMNGGFISSASSTISSNLNVTGNLNASGTLFVGANIIPSVNNNSNLGAFGTSFANIYSSSTIFGQVLTVVGTNDYSTSTFASSVNIGADDLIVDTSSTQTGITSLLTGGLSFDDDAGIVQAMDMAFTTTTASITNSYEFDLAGNPFMTIWGQTNGVAGGITKSRIGFATSTPAVSYDFFGIGGADNVTTTLSLGVATSTGKGTCLVMQDMSGTGLTYITAQGGVLTASTASCQ